MFAEGEGYRREFFSPNPADRPLVVQFCGNDPETLLKAARYVENDCDAVDINFGCPQGIAKKGKYGSFLLEKTELIRSLVSTLHQNLKVPVTCKMRCLPSEKDTLALALVMQEAGCQMLVVHGRCREHNKHLVGSANWNIIRKIKQTLRIPVIANGGISTYEDCL
jgi:tRNA-dihydrouridine synthase 1